MESSRVDGTARNRVGVSVVYELRRDWLAGIPALLLKHREPPARFARIDAFPPGVVM